jgi:hypothetical protein
VCEDSNLPRAGEASFQLHTLRIALRYHSSMSGARIAIAIA